MPSNQQTLSDLFDLAIQVENATEALYRRFADLFSHQPDVAKFWTSYANEEHGHALYVQRLREMHTPQQLSALGDASLLEMVHRSLERTLNYQIQTVETLDDAFQLAMELENSETNSIFEFMLSNLSTEELTKNQGFLRTQLKKHVNLLTMEFPSRFRSKVQRQELRAQPATA